MTIRKKATKKSPLLKSLIEDILNEGDFLLKGKDWSTPAVILLWMALNVNTASDEKMQSAFNKVMMSRKVPGRKVAD